MSRHGFCDAGDYDESFPNEVWLGWQATRNAINGKRGQKFLRDLAAAMDVMPVKVLGSGGLVDQDGMVCTLGVLAVYRGATVEAMAAVDDDDHNHYAAKLLGIAERMAGAIAYANDEDGPTTETPEQRWIRMRKWVEHNTKPDIFDLTYEPVETNQ